MPVLFAGSSSYSPLRQSLLGMRMRGNVSLLPNVAASATVEDGNGTKGVSSSTAISQAAAIGPMTWPARSDFCGSVSEDAVGREVTLCGWVDGYRNFGGVLFLDIRDHTGLVQVAYPPPPPPPPCCCTGYGFMQFIVVVFLTVLGTRLLPFSAETRPAPACGKDACRFCCVLNALYMCFNLYFFCTLGC